MKNIGILGSTGSIGKSTIEIIRLNKDKFKVKFLTANSNYELLAKQALELKPEIVVINEEKFFSPLKGLLKNTKIKILAGRKNTISVASEKCDIVMAAMIGAAGLEPVITAIEAGSDIALANKECLVCAGELILQKAKSKNVRIIPVDSEHNAIMQIFDENNKANIEKIIITASGGPFLNWSPEQMKNIRLEDALKHPNWVMGNKITIDSASMFNKAFEIIEAKHLFQIEPEKIEAIIHPESIIHSMVSYKNGSTLAQLSSHDMKIPISIALFWPEKNSNPIKTLNFSEVKNLSFFEPDLNKFPVLSLVKNVMKEAESSPIIMNAANEIAVHNFFARKLHFLEIYSIVHEMLSKVPNKKITNLDDVINVDEETRKKTIELIEAKKVKYYA